MEKKSQGIRSKAQAKHFYDAYKRGEISYDSLMKSVHATKDIKNLPDRVTSKRNTQTKEDLSIKGLV